MNIQEQLQLLNDIKRDIKSAIQSREGVVPDATPFSQYADIIRGLFGGDTRIKDYILPDIRNKEDVSGTISDSVSYTREE